MNILLMTGLYVLVMYFATLLMYKWKKIEITRPQVLLRAVISGAILYVLLYFLGK